MAALLAKARLSASSHYVTYEGRRLEPAATLANYGIRNGSTVVIMPRLLGGNPHEVTMDRFRSEGLEDALIEAVSAAVRADAADPCTFIGDWLLTARSASSRGGGGSSSSVQCVNSSKSHLAGEPAEGSARSKPPEMGSGEDAGAAQPPKWTAAAWLRPLNIADEAVAEVLLSDASGANLPPPPPPICHQYIILSARPPPLLAAATASPRPTGAFCGVVHLRTG